jgi:hypothetical protein
MGVRTGTMTTDQTNTTAVAPLLTLGDAEANVCADGFCAVPQAEETGPEIGREPRGADE